ncbi:MAG TPA: hypothetical protein IGS37_00620 [Synechococcales cyanobacterium M55_K2018_004]|nr:hypothetical protein [Synechococcales cyanobacterium M55_K2018_004]
MQHPLQSGQVFTSLGCHFTYRVVGPCCRLFDREELPWPCCRLEWRGKEPSWRRVGRRFVPDMASRNAPSYCVEILGQSRSEGQFVLTLYWDKLPQPIKDWWYARSPLKPEEAWQNAMPYPSASELTEV